MSAEKKHDYHLVDPSPWPIYVSFSCLFLAIGSVYYLHSGISWHVCWICTINLWSLHVV